MHVCVPSRFPIWVIKHFTSLRPVERHKHKRWNDVTDVSDVTKKIPGIFLYNKHSFSYYLIFHVVSDKSKRYLQEKNKLVKILTSTNWPTEILFLFVALAAMSCGGADPFSNCDKKHRETARSPAESNTYAKKENVSM